MNIINKVECNENRLLSYDNNLLKKEKRLVIVIDPHCSEDPGAIGENGLLEKNIVLSIAKKIKDLIDTQNNIDAYLTREQEYFMPLLARVQKARDVKADLLISIHADSWVNRSAQGSSVFTLSSYRASSALAKWIVDKENESDLIGGINLHSYDKNLVKIILDLSTSAQIKSSMKIGELLLNEIKKSIFYTKRMLSKLILQDLELLIYLLLL
ncbi:N-acetylmuramoyl-L-alanine amidase [Candidatus Kinetoplastidibacterium stringomonadis]|uniref:N-acetylmuramoyl-L-alanine amidase n=1 Tax=Candidatus Kinetoplastidibacterium stringomonadis TaxID=994696 RepID=UPI0004BCF8AF|nr:N-acetylmuramoyl-L-alanine amidase [Candidatus Kinetoplastibacterium oncopeltii]